MTRDGTTARRRGGWLVLTAATAVLPVALSASTSASSQAWAAGTGTAGQSSNWSGSWLGSADAGTPVTLAAVRTIIGADTGTAKTLTGQGVGIALIDTGVAPVAGLPAAQVVNGPDLSFESQSPDLRYLDDFGHGTHMAGIMIGNDQATGTVGIAPKAKLTSIKIGSANGAVDVSQTIAAIDWVVKHRSDDPANPIKIINLSYGSGGQPPTWTDPLGFAAEQAWQAGILVVAAAGNSGSAATVLTNPATDEWVLSVGAASTKGTLTTADDELAPYTNLPRYGGKQPDLLAPGTSIVSLRDPGSNIDSTYPGARVGDTLFRGTGTSQATAVTSAAAALLMQAKPSATPNQIKDWLIHSTTYLPTGVAANMGLQEINVNAAVLRSSGFSLSLINWQLSTGNGTLEAARGTSHVMFDNVALKGESTVWGPLSTPIWALKAATKTSWSGGLWMGYRLAGDGWTGTSWASKTWGSASWTGSPWSGGTWIDPAWSSRTWSSRTWSSGTWTSRTWSSDDWSTASWG